MALSQNPVPMRWHEPASLELLKDTPKNSLPEKDSTSPRNGGYRIPRCVANLVAARLVHLTIRGGIETVAGGEGPWNRGVRPYRPGVLTAGTNCVTTDAVAMAIMGYDPMAERGPVAFETCDKYAASGGGTGVGTRDRRQMEVIGTPIKETLFKFREQRHGLQKG